MSVSGRLLENHPVAKPCVGMGATLITPLERLPFTIIDVTSHRRRIMIQADSSAFFGGDEECVGQYCKFSPDPEGRKLKVSLRKDGSWRVCHEDTLVAIGYRAFYQERK